MPSVPLITENFREGENRRSALRQRIGSLTYLDLGANNGGFLIDVSEAGVQFQVVKPLVTDGIFRIKFKLSKKHDAIEAHVHVAWVDSSGKYGGLQFLDLDESPKLQIREWLAAQTTRTIQARLEENAGRLDEATGTREPQLSPESETKNSYVRAARDSSQTQLQVDSVDRNLEAAILHAEDSKKVSRLLNRTFQAANKQMSRSFLLKTIGSFAIVAVAGAFLLQLSRGRTVHLATPKPKGAVGSPLELKLERSGTDWQVSWNRNADVMLQAVGGHLSITDGSLRKELDLDPSELRSGSVMYAPLTGDVLVRLQVVGGNLAQPVSESVRVIAGTRASSQMSASRSPSGESTDLRSQLPSANAPTPFANKSATESSGKTSAPLTQSPSNAIPPKLESPKVRADSDKIETSANSLSQTPGVKSALADPGVSAPATSILAPSTLAEPIPKLPSELLPPSPPPRDAAPSGGKVDPPQLILRREPVYPSQAAQFGFAGEVEVHFFINPQGTVHSLTVVRGNPLLANAAVTAVSGWRYKPALLNGSPVETEARAVFDFKPK